MEFSVFILAWYCGVMLMFFLQSRWGVVGGVVAFLTICAIGRRMAEKDPYLTDIYSDALRYRQPWSKSKSELYFSALPEIPRTLLVLTVKRNRPRRFRMFNIVNKLKTRLKGE